jgi:hypothetical protein
MDLAVWGVKDTQTERIVVHFDTRSTAEAQARYRNGVNRENN